MLRIMYVAIGAVVLAIAPIAHSTPTLSFQIPPNPIFIGDTLEVGVFADNTVDLFAYQFSVNFDPLSIQAIEVLEGPFLASVGSTFFVPGTIDNLIGNISFTGNTLIGAVQGVNGSGLLASLKFTSLDGLLPSSLSFTDVLLLNSDLNDGSSTTVAEPSTLILLLGAIALLCVLRPPVRTRLRSATFELTEVFK